MRCIWYYKPLPVSLYLPPPVRRPSPLRLRTLQVQDLLSANLLITTESKAVRVAVRVQPGDCAPQARHIRVRMRASERARRREREKQKERKRERVCVCKQPCLRRRKPRRVESDVCASDHPSERGILGVWSRMCVKATIPPKEESSACGVGSASESEKSTATRCTSAGGVQCILGTLSWRPSHNYIYGAVAPITPRAGPLVPASSPL